MLHRFHDRFGTAGVVLGVIAIVLAVGGSAIAASGLNGKQKKEVKAIAKSFAGKPGAPGAAGTNGTNGTNGKDGTNGAPGAPGADGKSVVLAAAGSCPNGGTKVTVGAESKEICNGTNGAAGKNVVTGTEATGTGNCEGRGGATVEVQGEAATKKYACNGKEGSPWTAGGTLPVGSTETGSWFVTPSEVGVGEFFGRAAIEFSIPLAASRDNSNTHVAKIGDTPSSGCQDPEHVGEPSAENPEAAPGHFCVYVAQGTGGGFLAVTPQKSGAAANTPGVSRAGSLLGVFGLAEEEIWGTYAIGG